jgi:hypothetical protein
MGTNYYFKTKSKRLVKKYFAQSDDYCTWAAEYTLEDEPYFHYEIHLNKCSCGWRTLFQKHKCFSSFKELEEFYFKHQRYLKIFNEYGEEFTWNDYKDRVIGHSDREPEPVKWVYDIFDFDRHFMDNPRKTLHTVKCKPKEADLWIPFNHKEYFKSQVEARNRLGAWDLYVHDYTPKYWNDPDYKVDWTEGEFC